MRIAQVVCTFPPYSGGIGNSAYQIAELLGERHEVENFTPDRLKPWLRYGHGAFLPQLLWRLGRFDYIYLHYPFFGTAEVVWLFKLLNRRAKLIIHYHMDVKNLSFLAKLLAWPSRLIRRSLFDRAQVIVTASLDYVQSSQIAPYYRRHPEKFREIPFGVDLKKFQPKDMHLAGGGHLIERAKEIVSYINEKFIKRERLDILFVGALDRAHYFKGVDLLLAALSRLAKRYWHLTIVGVGDLLESYRATARNLGLEKQVDFRGKLQGDELRRAFQASELLVLPSINSNEAFGIVLIEALACGVPVLASDLAGVRKVFNDGREGFLFRRGDADDLKDKLEYIIHHEDRRRLMSKAARRLAEEKYSLEKMKEKLERLFL